MGVKVAFREAQPDESMQSARPGVLVPASALRKDGERDIVFVMKDGRAERRAVAAGAEQGSEAMLFSGVAPGERVIVKAPSDLEDGDAVEESR